VAHAVGVRYFVGEALGFLERGLLLGRGEDRASREKRHGETERRQREQLHGGPSGLATTRDSASRTVSAGPR